jgi:hypothetical protein
MEPKEKTGVMEYWSYGVLGFHQYSNTPPLHHSE